MARASVAWALMCAGLLPSAGLAQTHDSLDTLLYTPAQRQALVQSRIGQRGGAGSVAAASVGAAAVSSTRLDGVVARENGKGTAWINSEPVAQGSKPSARIQGTEAVVNGHRLRVGQSFDNATGAKSDVVAPGAIRHRLSP